MLHWVSLNLKFEVPLSRTDHRSTPPMYLPAGSGDLDVDRTDTNTRARGDVHRRDGVAGEHGRARLRGRLLRRHPRRRNEHRRHHRRFSQRAVPDAGGSHLPVRHRAEQRDRRSHGPGRRAPGAGSGRTHPVGDVRHHRGAHRGRRARTGGRGDHRAHRTRVRRPVQDQCAADGHDGHSRRAGRWLLPDQHLRRHRQHHHRRRGSRRQPPGPVPRQSAVQRRDRGAALRFPRWQVADRPTRRRPPPRGVATPTGPVRRVPGRTERAVRPAAARRPRRRVGARPRPNRECRPQQSSKRNPTRRR